VATILLKTEPGTYSFDDLAREKRTTWDGVSNPVALRNLRAARRGDEALIYHTGDQKAVVGLARVESDPREDPSNRGRTDTGEIKVPVIDLVPLKPAKTPVTLAAIKADPRFKDFALVRQSRLSVMPVPPDLDSLLRRMAGL
jgi:predicted RNA-binding protein with PUA-like domain